MGYVDYLKKMLKPLGVYDLSNGYGCAEINAVGMAMNTCCSEIRTAEREAFIQTAEDYGLSRYIDLFVPKPEFSTNSECRNALMTLMKVPNSNIDTDTLNSIIAGCGINAEVMESENALTIKVVFNEEYEDDVLAAMKRRIEQLMPCQFDIEYEAAEG